MFAAADSATAFYLACGLFGMAVLSLAMLGMAAHQWRRPKASDYRRHSVAMGAFALASLLALLLSQLSGDSLNPGLPLALETFSLALFGWAFLFEALPTGRWGRVAIGICLVLSVSLVVLSLFLSPGADLPLPALIPGLAGLLLVDSLALLLWTRTRPHASVWLGTAFALPALGVGAGLLGLEQAPWLGFLLGLPLFTIEVYRRLLADLSAYRHELQAVSQQAMQHTQEMARLLRVSQAVTASLNPAVVLERASEAVAQAVDADWSYVLLSVDDDPGVLTVAARYGWWGRREQDRQLSREVLIPIENYPLLQHAIQRRLQVLANRPEEYEQLKPLHRQFSRPQSGPTLVQPIYAQERPVGAVLLGRIGAQRAFTDADGQFCQALAGQLATAIDHARRFHGVDEQAQRLAALLRASEEEGAQSQAILASIADGVVVTNYAAEVIMANAAAERILGVPHEEQADRSVEKLHTALLPLAGQASGEQMIFAWGDKEIAGRMTPVELPDGTVLGYVTVCREVTREQRGEAAKAAFIETVSQDLYTSLTLAKGYIELLVAGAAGDIPPKQRRFLEKANENAEHMVRTLNNLIAISELEQGPIEVEARPVDMGSLVAEAVQAVREQAAASQVDLAVNLPTDLRPAWGDPGRLRQIVDNLLDNALRYNPSGGRVTVWAAEARLEDGDTAQRSYLVVSVRDTGVGIPEEAHELIFEPFYQADHPPLPESPGIGIGLAVVKALVEAHSGRVWVDSQPGRGSTFSFTVPTSEDMQAAVVKEAHEPGAG